MKFLYIYLIIINLIAVIVTVHDKRAAVRGSWRVKERTLLLIAALGGSPAMLLTMLLIRHKTRKAKFMVGIPLIIVLQLVIVFLVLHYGLGIL
ncbi:MAG: DUF1294 domain-containing protein [Ruminococcus sp.]|uniref:DUF1294 domain-containing protein n=1 Tax=Ruminococcus sp. TaxID=41978 RepID=UPI002873EB20|nr:DUF1294 domain-containing protein [Ruminococcus sp.]MBQ3284058.1 DUF1294 domain-containing protein [Ruminococcus sp.]